MYTYSPFAQIRSYIGHSHLPRAAAVSCWISFACKYQNQCHAREGTRTFVLINEPFQLLNFHLSLLLHPSWPWRLSAIPFSPPQPETSDRKIMHIMCSHGQIYKASNNVNRKQWRISDLEICSQLVDICVVNFPLLCPESSIKNHKISTSVPYPLFDPRTKKILAKRLHSQPRSRCRWHAQLLSILHVIQLLVKVVLGQFWNES